MSPEVDVTVYHDGFHADLNETLFVGQVDDASKKLVQTAYECMMKGISIGGCDMGTCGVLNGGCGRGPYRGIEWVGMKVIQYTVYFSGLRHFVAFVMMQFFPSFPPSYTCTHSYHSTSR